jgi:hypothetical protein
MTLKESQKENIHMEFNRLSKSTASNSLKINLVIQSMILKRKDSFKKMPDNPESSFPQPV